MKKSPAIKKLANKIKMTAEKLKVMKQELKDLKSKEISAAPLKTKTAAKKKTVKKAKK